ncbi:hypothetical protein CPB83DRAFT_653196 [Crepidotus variabilis]|uniref:Uncharacterized protein n=1 Tax=Crepidotus variabilis TaxID=179855 RepID=A0A9P6E794_9AGAR|nr:hypothetical protein CPB83DRAFT_653196 [Crepidotus variabilis]
MKAVVSSVGRASGLEDPSGDANLNANANTNANTNVNQRGAAAKGNDSWRNIFGPPARRQHGRQPFMDPWAGEYDEDEEDFEPHNIHDFHHHHPPFFRQRMLDLEDLSDDEDFDEDGLDEEEVQDVIDEAMAYWEGRRPRNAAPIADRMRIARGHGQGWRNRRRGAGAGAPGAPAGQAVQENQDNGAFGWHDAEDGGIYRCWDCMHEIWDGHCAGCGRRYDLPPNHRRDLDLNDNPHRDLFVDDEAALEEQIGWLDQDVDEDEEEEELNGGGFGGVYRRRPYDYEVDVDEEDEEAEPGEFDGWLDDDNDEGRLRAQHEVFHNDLEEDDDDDPDGDVYADEWHGLHHRHPHHYHRNRVVPDEDDEVEVVEDGPPQELLSDDEGEEPVQIARTPDRRVQLAALRRRGLLVMGDEENAEDDDGEESDIVEVVEHIPHAPRARRMYVETSDEEDEEPPLRIANGGLLQRNYVDSSDEEEGPLGLRAAARRFGRAPVRNVGANANIGARNGYARRAARAVVLSDDEEEE